MFVDKQKYPVIYPSAFVVGLVNMQQYLAKIKDIIVQKDGIMLLVEIRYFVVSTKKRKNSGKQKYIWRYP